MNTDIYVCSKPLQYFNARNIPKGFHPGHRRVLVLVANFYNADDFYVRVKKNDSSWSDIVKVSNVWVLYVYLLLHRFHSLIYGYDTSTILGIIHLLKKYDFYIIEEGLSTYFPIDGFDKRKNIIQEYLDKKSGVSTHWGHTSFVKGAFVYYPGLYKQLRTPNFNPTPFAKPFVEKVTEDISLFLTLSGVEDRVEELLNISDRMILLYITGWQINQKIIDRMDRERKDFDYTIIKPHPHIRDYSAFENRGLTVFKSNLMVEFLLCLWLKQGNKIFIYHEGSTAVFYFKGIIKAEDLSQVKDDTYHRLIRGELKKQHESSID